MTYKQINQAHEARMWIKEVIVPITATTILLISNDDVRRVFGKPIENKIHKVGNFINKITKKEKKSTKSDIVDCDFYVVR